nr:transcriptional corepressor LEUNIG-like isoform X2 [Ipomoea batatas]
MRWNEPDVNEVVMLGFTFAEINLFGQVPVKLSVATSHQMENAWWNDSWGEDFRPRLAGICSRGENDVFNYGTLKTKHALQTLKGTKPVNNVCWTPSWRAIWYSSEILSEYGSRFWERGIVLARTRSNHRSLWRVLEDDRETRTMAKYIDIISSLAAAICSNGLIASA